MKSDDHTDAVVSAALAGGHLDDSKFDGSLAQDIEPSPPAVALPPRELRPWEKEPDPWTDLGVRQSAADPYGLEVMKWRHEKGLSSDAELEATKFFWGEAKEHVARETDPTKALALLKFFGERGYIDDAQLDPLARGIADREFRRHTEENARVEAEAQKELDRAEAEVRELQRVQDIENRIHGCYAAAARELLGPEDG